MTARTGPTRDGSEFVVDVPRTRRRPGRRRLALAALVAILIGAITFATRGLARRDPVVARDQLWIATVERGPLTLAVRGQGTLVPTEFRWASSPVAARVDQVRVQPGAEVEAGTVLLQLANPDVELAALTADRDVAQAEAELARLAAQLDGSRLAQESAVAGLDAELAMAERRKAIDTAMANKGVIAELERLESTDRASQVAGRLAFERKRLAAQERGNAAQLSAQRSQLEQLRALAELRHRQLDALTVRAGQAGVVQEVAVEAGQSVAAGAPLAKIVVPDRLMARLRVPETATADLAIGLTATIDTRTGIVTGVVARIDPAAHGGNVTVDVRLTGAPPRAARVDQNVDGVIQLARTGDVLHVARPAIGEAHRTASLFVVTGGEARRRQVSFGRAAESQIEIASGLSAGEQVVLTDMSRWDGTDRLRIE